MTSKRNGDESSVPIAQPSESVTIDGDGAHPSVGFQKNGTKLSEPIGGTSKDDTNPVASIRNSREETHDPKTLWVSDYLQYGYQKESLSSGAGQCATSWSSHETFESLIDRHLLPEKEMKRSP
jgi:hypothetical protein